MVLTFPCKEMTDSLSPSFPCHGFWVLSFPSPPEAVFMRFLKRSIVPLKICGISTENDTFRVGGHPDSFSDPCHGSMNKKYVYESKWTHVMGGPWTEKICVRSSSWLSLGPRGSENMGFVIRGDAGGVRTPILGPAYLGPIFPPHGVRG